MKEKFQIPAVGAIIEREISGRKEILIQNRVKNNAPLERNLIEIPAGKIREFENIFNALRREVFEETGLTITEIQGENPTKIVDLNNYKVINFEPFYISQNIIGNYPIMITTFICKATGKILKRSNESENIRWIQISDLKNLLQTSINTFYPMHVMVLNKYIEMCEREI